jgi:hypothetical protein
MVSSRKKKMALSWGTLLESALVKTVTPDLGGRGGEAWVRFRGRMKGSGSVTRPTWAEGKLGGWGWPYGR